MKTDEKAVDPRVPVHPALTRHIRSGPPWHRNGPECPQLCGSVCLEACHVFTAANLKGIGDISF